MDQWYLNVSMDSTVEGGGGPVITTSSAVLGSKENALKEK